MTYLWGHLKGKVLAFGIAMSVLPLALYGWYGLSAARRAQVEVVQAQNQAAARTVAEELAQFVRRITRQLGFLADLEGRTLIAAPEEEQLRALYTLLRDVDDLEMVALVDRSGREVARASRREVWAGLDLPSYAGTPLWEQIREGRTALGSVTLDVDGRPLFTVGVPLPDRSGAIVAQASLRGLVAKIAAVRGRSPVKIHVLDGEGRLIGDTDFSLVLAGSRADLPPDDGQPYRSISGEQALGVAAPVPGLPWWVVGETTMEAAMEPVNHLARDFALGGAGIMAVVIALSVVAGLLLTGPLERLEAGARRIGAGDLSYRIPGGGLDELGRLVAAFNAMTERLQAQDAALRAERDRLDMVVSSIGAGLALIDGRGQVVWVNRTLRDWFPGPLVGRPCWEVLRRGDCAGCPGGDCPDTTGSASGGGPEGANAPVPAGAGRERQVIIGGRHRLIRYHTYQLGESRLEVLEDITERRRMEQMVLQAEKLAAVGQLAAGVAHEINNPLAVIAAYAEDLADRLREEGAASLTESGELDAYLEQLQAQVRRCKGITMNLLDFARRGPTEPEPVDVAEVARQTAALIAPQARKLGVTVEVALPEGLPAVRASRDQLQQVFLNVLTNALDAMEQQGGGQVQIRTEGVRDGMVRVLVSDTGPGMDSATLERALEPFFTTKPPGRGTGLGLSTCYGIITGLGGQMTITSAPGQGTSVAFALPLWEGGDTSDGSELQRADRRG